MLTIVRLCLWSLKRFHSVSVKVTLFASLLVFSFLRTRSNNYHCWPNNRNALKRASHKNNGVKNVHSAYPPSWKSGVPVSLRTLYAARTENYNKNKVQHMNIHKTLRLNVLCKSKLTTDNCLGLCTFWCKPISFFVFILVLYVWIYLHDNIELLWRNKNPLRINIEPGGWRRCVCLGRGGGGGGRDWREREHMSVIFLG